MAREEALQRAHRVRKAALAPQAPRESQDGGRLLVIALGFLRRAAEKALRVVEPAGFEALAGEMLQRIHEECARKPATVTRCVAGRDFDEALEKADREVLVTPVPPVERAPIERFGRIRIPLELLAAAGVSLRGENQLPDLCCETARGGRSFHATHLAPFAVEEHAARDAATAQPGQDLGAVFGSELEVLVGAYGFEQLGGACVAAR